MAQPHAGQVHVDSVLTDISVAYVQRQTNFIATKVFPVVPVDKQSDSFFKYNKGDWFRDEAQRRAPSTESAGGGYNLSTDSYRCDVYAFHKDLDDQTLANADAPQQPRREAAEFVVNRMLMKQEKAFMADFMATGKWGTDITGVSGAPSTNEVRQWSDFTNSDPLEDVEAWKELVLGVTGELPNTLVLGYQVFRKLKNHPDIIDRIKYTSGIAEQLQTERLLAAMFDVDRVLVAKAIQNTAQEGATDAFSFITGKIAWLGYVAPNPGLLVPSAGYTFAWTGVSDGLGESVGTVSIDMPTIRSERIESQMAWDNKVIGADLGVFVSSLVA